MKRSFIYYFLGFLIILVFVFRTLLQNFSTNLLDWHDYPFAAWVIISGTQKLMNLDFVNFFNTNIFYPFTNTAFFTDLMLPQSAIAILPQLISDNPIIVFNFVFIFSFILNYISVYFFWQYLFKKPFLSFLGSLFIIFSPYFFLEIGHFQMQSYWPFFLSFALTLKSIRGKKPWLGILAGLTCTIQFLASVYLGVFLLFTITIYAITELFFNDKKVQVAKSYLFIATFFFLTAGVFIKGYADTKFQYEITRSPNEFITYSAHISDYFFTSPIHSFIHTSQILKIWNGFDKHTIGSKAAFPGFTLFFLAVHSLIGIKASKKQIDIRCSLDKQNIFFILLTLSGLVFSWGPRINFNGVYAAIPSPYYIFLKFIPFLESVRAPARWSFLFYFGIVYFALLGIQKIIEGKKSFVYIVIILIIFLLEYIPLKIETHGEEFINKNYKALQKVCKNNKLVLLEVPITHFDGNGGIINGLNRVTKYELASLIHNCYLKNGYSGFDMPTLLSFKENFYTILSKRDLNLLISFLEQNDVSLLKINKDGLSEKALIDYNQILTKIEKSNKIESIGKDTYLLK